MRNNTGKEKLWLNPGCGLKMHENAETAPSLENLVREAKEVCDEIK